VSADGSRLMELIMDEAAAVSVAPMMRALPPTPKGLFLTGISVHSAWMDTIAAAVNATGSQ
jgi:hypothetical protein